MTLPDLLRLVAVPVLGWAAWRDHRTRRVPGRTWYPLAALGAALLVWEGIDALGAPAPAARLFGIRVAISLGLLVPMAYGFWRFGGFGAADAKAFAVLALLFPTYPAYAVGGVVLPLERPPIGVFSLSIVTDGALLGAAYPAALAARNALAGRFAPVMFVGRPVGWADLPATHGRLLETPDGFAARGLDLDALRMYLRWRGVSLAEVRERPAALRDPSTLPDEPNPPTDGRVDPRLRPDGGADDPWGAAAFLDSIEGSAYGTTPEGLRAGLEVVAAEDAVWVSPGLPFLVPLFFGLVVALVYGDVLFGLLRLAGLA